MMHVQARREPNNFDKLVRQPGHRFLNTCPNPTTAQLNNRDYWVRILPALYKEYGEICAYSCHWIPPDTGSRSVEHFLPKKKHPREAYEWDNYRLVCGTLNGRKGTRAVLDPFKITTGWFVINFPSLLVKPADGLGTTLSKEVQTAIDILGLNDEGTCLQGREGYLKDYCRDCITFGHLSKKAPFLGFELQRQNLVTTIKDMMRYSPKPCNA